MASPPSSSILSLSYTGIVERGSSKERNSRAGGNSRILGIWRERGTEGQRGERRVGGGRRERGVGGGEKGGRGEG